MRKAASGGEQSSITYIYIHSLSRSLSEYKQYRSIPRREATHLYGHSVLYAEKCDKGWTPIVRITKQFPTSRQKLFGMINQFPLGYGYNFTIAKSQGNNNIGIHTVVHLEKDSLSRREMYVAFSRSDKLEYLHIVGSFTDPFHKEDDSYFLN